VNTGVPNADFALFVTAKQTPTCGPNTLAFASYCQHDQYDRPTIARANFCPQVRTNCARVRACV
jgi:leishmanolysin-like peptidase